MALSYNVDQWVNKTDDTKLLRSRLAGRMKLARRFNGGKVQANNRVPVRGRLNLRWLQDKFLVRFELASL
jgi:hypothetical protein